MDELEELKAAGAQLVDVRSQGEFAQGHAAGTVNIPLDELPGRTGELDPARPVILVCAGGGRSGMAKMFLDRSGFPRTFNAGAWTRLQ